MRRQEKYVSNIQAVYFYLLIYAPYKFVYDPSYHNPTSEPLLKHCMCKQVGNFIW